MFVVRPTSAHDGPAVFSSKTPGRALRGQENAVSRTHAALSKGKQVYQTPLRDDNLKSTKLFNTSKATGIRPFLDKTPYNRNAPAATPAPGGKLNAFLFPETPGYLLRPSSTRKSVRTRRSSGRNLFETPVTNGNHWDVSDTEIETAPVEEVQEEQVVEDYDEIEYMPPTAIEQPYEPVFEMPDYKVAGKMLFDSMHSYKYDDRTDLYYAAERANMPDEGLLEASGYTGDPSQWDLLTLPELEDDSPFAQAAAESSTSAVQAPEVKPIHSRPASAAASRYTSSSRAPSKVGTASRPTMSRVASRTVATNIPTRTAGSSTKPISTSSKTPVTNVARAGGSRPMTAMSFRPAPSAAASRRAAPAPSHSAGSSVDRAGSAGAMRPATATLVRPGTSAAIRAPVKTPMRPATSLAMRPAKPAVPKPLVSKPATAASTRRPLAPAQTSKRKTKASDDIFCFEATNEDLAEDDFLFDV